MNEYLVVTFDGYTKQTFRATGSDIVSALNYNNQGWIVSQVVLIKLILDETS